MTPQFANFMVMVVLGSLGALAFVWVYLWLEPRIQRHLPPTDSRKH